MKEPGIVLICLVVVIAFICFFIDSCEKASKHEIEKKYIEFSSDCLFVPTEKFDDFLKKNSNRIKCFASNDTGMYGITIGYYVILEEEKTIENEDRPVPWGGWRGFKIE